VAVLDLIERELEELVRPHLRSSSEVRGSGGT
jgi:hypothetical protein